MLHCIAFIHTFKSDANVLHFTSSYWLMIVLSYCIQISNGEFLHTSGDDNVCLYVSWQLSEIYNFSFNCSSLKQIKVHLKTNTSCTIISTESCYRRAKGASGTGTGQKEGSVVPGYIIIVCNLDSTQSCQTVWVVDETVVLSVRFIFNWVIPATIITKCMIQIIPIGSNWCGISSCCLQSKTWTSGTGWFPSVKVAVFLPPIYPLSNCFLT